jgi:hypothetical protein
MKKYSPLSYPGKNKKTIITPSGNHYEMRNKQNITVSEKESLAGTTLY